MAKIYISSGELNAAGGTGVGEHSYWVYDPDGDPTTGAERRTFLAA